MRLPLVSARSGDCNPGKAGVALELIDLCLTGCDLILEVGELVCQPGRSTRRCLESRLRVLVHVGIDHGVCNGGASNWIGICVRHIDQAGSLDEGNAQP